MKFQCSLCENIIEIHRVKFTMKQKELICEEAICCDSYMEQVKTDEYKGIPDIKRNEIKHSRQAIEEKFNNKMKGE